MKKVRKVLVHQRWRFEFGASVVEGVMDFATKNTEWEVVTMGSETPFSRQNLETLKIDGVIGDGFHASSVRAAAELNVPFVDVTGAGNGISSFGVEVNNRVVGEMAFSHFQQKGLRNMAFVGFRNHRYSIARNASFREAALRNSLQVSSCEEDFFGDSESVVEESLLEFLQMLEKPCGVFACSDVRAWSLVNASRKCGFNVPDNLAILGVDNDLRLQRLMKMELSSIDTRPRLVGWKAASLLYKLLNGEDALNSHVVIDPVRIVEKISTRGFYSEHPVINRFLLWIEENGRKHLGIADAAKSVGCSRRNLESLCRRFLGESPYHLVQQHRLSLALSKIIESNDTLAEISETLGFERQSDMTRLFKKVLGRTPSSYRQY